MLPYKRFLSLVSLLLLCHSTTSTIILPQKEKTKVELQDLNSINFTSSYFDSYNPDLAYLRIIRSQIDEIDPLAFDRFKHLNFLEITESAINGDLHRQTFSRLPSLEILILRDVGLQYVDLNLTNVQELVLSQNAIEKVKEDGLVGHNINYLDLSGNRIRKLENSFKSLSKLSLIDLSKNKIDFIGNDVFKENHYVLRILASENKITSTDGLRLPQLKTLDLFANKLTVLDESSFSNMPFLEELVLAFNTIKTLKDPFKDLTELKFVNLAWNFIGEIRPDLFRNNLYLNHLSLQGNRITVLERFVNNLEHLVRLDASHNDLTYISDDFFEATPSLASLDLSFNKLKTLTDSLQPMTKLAVLDLAYNNLVLAGYEFANNNQISRLNLSSNRLELGISYFKTNTFLTNLDLSDNAISNFCDSNVTLEKLVKINLRGNHIQSLNCLKEKSFESLCQLDLRNNPLICGNDLEELMLALALKKGSPYQQVAEFQTDTVQTQCVNLSLNQSFHLWNGVKRDLCPTKEDLQVKEIYKDAGVEEADKEEDEESEESDETDYSAEIDEKLDANAENKPKDENDKHYIVIPIGRMSKDMFKDGSKVSGYQSERVSWEQIDENPQFVNELEEEDLPNRSHYNWFTIAVVLIALSLTLTCFNLAVFTYIRLRVWKRSDSSQQKYTFLKNEIYKNTTEPSPKDSNSDNAWFPDYKLRNKIFSYGKMNEFFLNFTGNKKDADTESTKNILTHSTVNLKI